jgi:hypothetical protein
VALHHSDAPWLATAETAQQSIPKHTCSRQRATECTHVDLQVCCVAELAAHTAVVDGGILQLNQLACRGTEVAGRTGWEHSGSSGLRG